jgi:preprotein translocase subunit SecA
LDVALGKMDAVTSKELLELMYAMPQGRRAAFDKKTHRRVWVRTNRMTYIYNAARLIENRDPDEIAEDVLAHLKDAQTAIRYEWGQNEFNRLVDVCPADLDKETQDGLIRVLGSDGFSSIGNQEFRSLDEQYRTVVINELGRQGLTKVYRQLMLNVISSLWVEYLTQVEALRVSIGLEAYAQRDPLVQYKTRAFEMFQDLMRDIRLSIVSRMFTFQTRDVSALQASVSREEPVVEGAKETPQEKTAVKKKKRRRRRRR